MISNHKDDIHPQGLLQGRIDRDIHPRGLLQTGRQKRVQAQEQPTNAQIAGLPKIDVPWKAGSSGSALSLGASVGSGFLVGGPVGAALGAGAFIASKVFGKDKPTGIPKKTASAWLDKVSSVLKTYSPEDQKKILSSNDPVIKQYILIRDAMKEEMMPPVPGDKTFEAAIAEQEKNKIAAMSAAPPGAPVRELVVPGHPQYEEFAARAELDAVHKMFGSDLYGTHPGDTGYEELVYRAKIAQMNLEAAQILAARWV